MSRPKRARAPRNFTLDLSGPSLALSAAGSSTDGRQIVHKGKAPEKMLFNNHDPAALLPEMSEKAKGKRKAVEKIGKEKQQLSGARPTAQAKQRKVGKSTVVNQVRCTIPQKVLDKSWRTLEASDQELVLTDWKAVAATVLRKISGTTKRKQAEAAVDTVSNSLEDTLASLLVPASIGSINVLSQSELQQHLKKSAAQHLALLSEAKKLETQLARERKLLVEDRKALARCEKERAAFGSTYADEKYRADCSGIEAAPAGLYDALVGLHDRKDITDSVDFSQCLARSLIDINV